jgi:hypothetical protein
MVGRAAACLCFPSWRRVGPPVSPRPLDGCFKPTAPARPLLLIFALALLLAGCGHSGERSAVRPASAPSGEAATAIQLRDAAAEAGVRFRHTSGASGRLYLAETVGSGCAFLDYDGDGRLDLFLVNSSRLPGFTGKGPFYPALYHQRPDGHFEDVTKRAGLAIDCYGMGCAVGDYDNDGHLDLYLTALGPDHLFHNNGNGSFTDVTASAGINAPEWNTSAAWVDYDRDGDLDLFVCGYCRWTPALNRDCPDHHGEKHPCSPRSYNGVPARLYRNDGARGGRWRFTDVAASAGVRDPAGKSLAVLVCDENDDGWPDLLVANDLEPTLLYRNQRNGTFREAGVEEGVAYSASGKARAGMGLDSADLTGAGRESFLVGNFEAEGLGLYQPDAQGQFTDVAAQAGLVPASDPYLTFGVLFCDFDLDGYPEILAADGHIDPNIALKGIGTTFRQRPQLFHSREGGRFEEITASAGPGLQTPSLYRGLAMGDYDGDGDPDVLVSANNGAPLLLNNSGTPRNHWLQVRLRGTRSNRDGIGTRIRVTAAGRTQTGWVRSGSSYASSHDLRAFFGLGAAATADRIDVRWPTGATQTLTNVPANQVLTVPEGSQ